MTFAYRIDYASAIAEDERTIAHLTDPLTIAAAAMLAIAAPRFPHFNAWSVYSLVTTNPANAAAFGLAADDVRAWRVFSGDGIAAEIQPGDHRRGAELDAKWATFTVYTDLERADALKKARTALARHRRNATKWGRARGQSCR